MTHEAEAWDDLLFGRGESEGGVKCRYCGLPGLRWEETDRGWRLYDASDKQHRCSTAHDATAMQGDNMRARNRESKA